MTDHKCRWEISGSGDLEIPFSELVGMSEEEIEDWLMEGAEMEIREQGNYHVSLRWDKERVMEALREYEKEQEEHDLEEI